MSGLRTRLTHWWQRNFGCVYLTETKWNGERQCFRFKARFGRIAFVWWACPFVCLLANNGDVINLQQWMRGFGMPFPGWRWSYEPTTVNVRNGGAW